MSRMKSGAIILLLAIPFGLYCAWQVQSVTRTDLNAAEPPSDKGLPGADQLAAAKGKTEKWAADVRRASAVALQYRAPTPEDAIDDPTAKALAAAAATRAADLTDLEKFLAGVEKPVFGGGLKAKFADWQASRKKLEDAERVVLGWLGNPLPDPVDGPIAAATALQGFEEMLNAYRGASDFADLSKADGWRIEARVKIVAGLEEAARKPYEEVLALPIPLPSPKDSPLVAKAVGGPAAIREQVKLIQEDIARLEEARRTVPARVTKAAADAKTRAEEWAAKEQLLALFADPELFTDPRKAADWIPKIQAQYNRTQTEAGRELIKKKVKQFCEAYIPRAVRLDSEVLIFKGEEEVGRESRSTVAVKYDSDAKTQKLTDSLTGLNEFNYLKLFKNPDSILWKDGSRQGGVSSTELRPTAKSLVARDFATARATVTTWTLAAVNDLKKKCEGEDEALQKERQTLADELLGAGPGDDKKPPPKIWTRLSALAEVMEKHAGLFDTPR